MFRAPFNDVVTDIRRKAVSLIVTAGLLALTNGLLFAAPTHEVCVAMRHSCDSAETTCCCGDRSDVNPAQLPQSISTDNAQAAHCVPAAALTFASTATTTAPVRPGPPLARAPDLRILFGDLRI